MKTISQREFANNAKGVLDGVERGETYRITRNGAEVAEVRPVSNRRRFVPVAELLAAVNNMTPVDHRAMREEADAFFGDDGDRL